jgi:hypothetical protein
MVRNGGVDVDGIHLWIIEYILITTIAFFYAEEVSNGIETDFLEHWHYLNSIALRSIFLKA